MPAVLYLCPDGAARGPLAEAIARHHRPDVDAVAAAWAPGHVRRPTRRVLREVGIEDRGLRARGLLEVDLRDVVAIVRLSDEPGCPPLPSRIPLVERPLPDPDAAPASETMEAHRDTRDALERMLPALIDSLVAAAPSR